MLIVKLGKTQHTPSDIHHVTVYRYILSARAEKMTVQSSQNHSWSFIISKKKKKSVKTDKQKKSGSDSLTNEIR